MKNPKADDHLFAIGSMLGAATAKSKIWGTGTLRWSFPVCAEADYRMVRGPLSYAAIRAGGGHCPPTWGDPGAFVREIFPAFPTAYEWCVVLHFREEPLPEIDGVNVMRPNGDPAEFCRRLSAARFVLSSSLHGLVAAHAYGLKAAWLKLSDRPIGDDTKFRDYLLGHGLNPEPVVLTSIDYQSIARTRPSLVEADFDLNQMRRCCPYVSN